MQHQPNASINILYNIGYEPAGFTVHPPPSKSEGGFISIRMGVECH